MRFCLLLCTLFALSACTPIPFVSPPVRVSIGFGPAGGEGSRTDTGEVGPVDTLPVISARFAVTPLGLIHDQIDRSYDIGVGYGLDDALDQQPTRALLHGPFLEGSYYFHQHMTGPGTTLRWGVTTRADLLFSESHADTLGWGAVAGFVFEYSWFGLEGFAEEEVTTTTSRTHTTTEVRPSMIGVAYGEFGIGAEIVGGYRELGPEKFWVVLGALVFRLPASAGVYFAYWDDEDN